MGAEISGGGTSDRSEAGRLFVEAAGTGGDIFVKNAPAASMETFLQCIRRSGVKIDIQPDGIGVSAPPRLSAS